MNHQQLATALKQQLQRAYPNIEVRVVDKSDSTREVYFVEEKFRVLYPQQRYHYLIHAIDATFYQEHLEHTIWFELAPGESPEELYYPDPSMIESITEPVMLCVRGSKFMEKLDDVMCPAMPWKKVVPCAGDFAVAKSVLGSCGFREDEYSDVLHVFMAQGAFCDCEILYNVAKESRLRSKYWKKRPTSFHNE